MLTCRYGGAKKGRALDALDSCSGDGNGGGCTVSLTLKGGGTQVSFNFEANEALCSESSPAPGKKILSSASDPTLDGGLELRASIGGSGESSMVSSRRGDTLSFFGDDVELPITEELFFATPGDSTVRIGEGLERPGMMALGGGGRRGAFGIVPSSVAHVQTRTLTKQQQQQKQLKHTR